MKTIRPGFETVLAILNTQQYEPGQTYRRSIYIAETDCPDGRLLYHTLSGALLLLDSTETGEWDRNPNLRKVLVERWFLVPDSEDEWKRCEQVRYVAGLLQNEKSFINRYIVFTTTDCNARCYYCFEHGQRRFSMTEQTARDVADYMLLHAQGERIRIRWFGGEPLLNVKAIDIISEALQRQGVEYASTMVTNGYLLDASLLEKANRLWHLRQTFITIDGTEEQYNRTKAYVYREGSAYRRVLVNIDRALDAGIAVTVNLNLDAQNAQMQFALADALGQRYGGRSNFAARAGLLIAYGNGSYIHAFDGTAHAWDTLQALNEHLERLGIRQKRSLPTGLKRNGCMADNMHSMTVLPDGRLGKCEHFGDREQVGSIYDGVDEPNVAAWKERKPVEEACKTCVCYPECMPLKKCNAFTNPCSEVYRREKELHLKFAIRDSYDRMSRKDGELNENEM